MQSKYSLAILSGLMILSATSYVSAEHCSHCADLRHEYNERLQCAKDHYDVRCRNLLHELQTSRQILLDELHAVATSRCPDRHLRIRAINKELACIGRDYASSRRALDVGYHQKRANMIRERELAMRACRQAVRQYGAVPPVPRHIAPTVPHPGHDHNYLHDANRVPVHDWRDGPYDHTRRVPSRPRTVDGYEYSQQVKPNRIDVGDLILQLIASRLDR